MIGVYICPKCHLSSIRPLKEKTDEQWHVCPACNEMMELQREKLDKVEREWVDSMKDYQ